MTVSNKESGPDNSQVETDAVEDYFVWLISQRNLYQKNVNQCYWRHCYFCFSEIMFIQVILFSALLLGSFNWVLVWCYVLLDVRIMKNREISQCHIFFPCSCLILWLTIHFLIRLKLRPKCHHSTDQIHLLVSILVWNWTKKASSHPSTNTYPSAREEGFVVVSKRI